MKVRFEKTIEVEADVTILDIIDEMTDEEIVCEILDIDREIASWDFSLLLMKKLLSRNLEIMNSESSLNHHYEEECEELYGIVKAIKRKLKKNLREWV